MATVASDLSAKGIADYLRERELVTPVYVERSLPVRLDDGRKVTVEMVRPMIAEELAKVKATVSAQGEDTASYDQAAVIFDKMSLTPEYPEFLTLPLYEAMA